MDELNLDTLADFNYDITSVVDDTKLDVLQSLGVNTSDFIKDQQDILDTIEEKVPEVTIDTDVDEPNLILPRADLVRALRYASIMIRKVTNDIEASSLNITYKDEGKVEYRLKDNMTWVTIEGACAVSHNKPILKTLSFNTSYLTKLLSTSTNDFLIYEGKAIDAKGEEKQVYYVRLSNGDYIIDVFEGNDTKLIPAGNKVEKLGTIAPNVLSTLCDVMTPLINDTQEVQSKRTILYNDRAIFRSATYLLQFKNAFSPMCFGKKDLDLLKLLSANGVDVEVYSTDSNGENRIVIQTPNVSISTSVSIPNRDEVIVARLNELENAKYIKVNKNDFKKVLFLSGLGISTVATVEMNYNVDNLGVDAKIISKNGNSSLLIEGENYNNLEPLNQNIVIYAPQILTLLKSFEGGKDLEVAFLQSGVALKDTTLGIEAIMNYAR